MERGSMSSAQAEKDVSEQTDADERRARPRISVSEKDEASLALVALRDLALVAALLSIFAAAETWATLSGLALAKLLSDLRF